MSKLVSIKLKFVPFYSIFRYDHTWWYYVPPADSPENAIETSQSETGDIRSKIINGDTIVAAYAYELSKRVMPYAKQISLNENT